MLKQRHVLLILILILLVLLVLLVLLILLVLLASDHTRPKIIQGSVNYSTGYFEFLADETIDVTPLSNVNTTLFVVQDNTGSHVVYDLSTATKSLTTDPVNTAIVHANYVQTRDGDTIKVGMFINEDDRITALLQSSTPGSLHPHLGSLRIQVLAGAFFDIGQNNCLDVQSLVLNEYPDTIEPLPYQVIVEYDIGKVVMRFTEYIDVTPQSTIMLAAIVREQRCGVLHVGCVYFGAIVAALCHCKRLSFFVPVFFCACLFLCLSFFRACLFLCLSFFVPVFFLVLFALATPPRSRLTLVSLCLLAVLEQSHRRTQQWRVRQQGTVG
jgi:hypothetical protein